MIAWTTPNFHNFQLTKLTFMPGCLRDAWLVNSQIFLNLSGFILATQKSCEVILGTAVRSCTASNKIRWDRQAGTYSGTVATWSSSGGRTYRIQSGHCTVEFEMSLLVTNWTTMSQLGVLVVINIRIINSRFHQMDGHNLWIRGYPQSHKWLHRLRPDR